MFLLFLFLLGSCAASSKKNVKPIVLVTIPPYAYFVQQIAGDFAEVKIFVPPGANPHIYEPTPRQVEGFTRSTLWLRYGDPIELKILPFLREHQVKDIDLSEGFSLICEHPCDHHHEGQDHHLWLDPVLAKEQARKIADALSAAWPDHQSQFEAGFSALSDRLTTLNQKLSSELQSVKGSYLLLSHPALGYYCHRYSLHQLSIECEGKDPLPRQIASIVQQARLKHVKVVLTEPQYSTKGATLVAEKLQIPTANIDPYAFNYFDMLEQITQILIDHYDH